MRSPLGPIIALFTLALFGAGSARAAEPIVVLWSGGAPGAKGAAAGDIPAITPYLPAPGHANGAAMVVCPGGGYTGLADTEGPPLSPERVHRRT